MAKWLKPPWSWNVTVFSIPLTLERMDIHKSAWGWSSRMILKVLFYYHLCLSDSVACNTAVCPDACSSIPCCSSNSTWQMQRTRKKIKVSSKERTCAPPSLGDLFLLLPLLQVLPVCFAGTVCHSMHGDCREWFASPGREIMCHSGARVFASFPFKH